MKLSNKVVMVLFGSVAACIAVLVIVAHAIEISEIQTGPHVTGTGYCFQEGPITVHVPVDCHEVCGVPLPAEAHIVGEK